MPKHKTRIRNIKTILTAASAVMVPFSTTGLTITVSAVDIAAKSGTSTCCNALVRWTYTQGGTLRPCSTPLTQVANGVTPTATNIPASVISANQSAGYNYAGGSTSYLIITDVTYTYVPFFPQAVSWFSSGMKKTTFMVPRDSTGPVTIASPSSAPSGQSGTICFS